MFKMTKILAILAMIVGLGLGTLMAPQAAQAMGSHHHHGHGHGHGFFPGFFIASAFNAPYYYYGPSYYYGPDYYDAGYYYGPDYYGSDCFWARKRVRQGGVLHWRRVWVCR
jgi:hypothetical protein